MKLFFIFLSTILLIFIPCTVDAKKPDKRGEWDNSLSHLQAAQTASANRYVAEAERLINIGKTKSGVQLIELLKDAGDRLQKAIACHAIVLEKTKIIGNEAYRQSLADFQSGIVKTIENYQAEIRHLQHHIGFLEAFEKAKLTISVCEEKKIQAASYVSHYSFPNHLKEIEISIHYFNEAAKLYREAEDGYINAISLFNPYSTPNALENKSFFTKQAADCRDLAANCIKQAEEWPIRKQSQILALKEQLALLKSEEEGERAQEQMVAILQELVDVNAADQEELFAVEKQLALSHQQNIQGEKTRPFFEDSYKKEQTRKELFYQHLPSLSHKSNQLTFLIDRLFKPGPFAIPLDGQYLLEGRYAHYLGQFYRVLVGTPPPTDFKVKVYEDGNVIYEEMISLPKKGSPAWNTYLLEEGAIHLPKTELNKRYGLQLRVKILSEFECVLALKGDLPYQFSICFENQPMYTFGFNAPPPWQLEVLQKPILPNFKPPLLNNSPNCKPPQESIQLRKGDELIPHYLLNQLVEELKKDPLAIAQYVQNEIDLVDPFLFRTDKLFEAPLLHRSALGTFLEGAGSPWEQCALLLYLLQEAGCTTIYAQAKCALPADYVERLLFTKLPQEKEVILSYPFVLLEESSGHWISLFPWMKNVQVAEGYDLYSLMPDDYASANRWIQRYLTDDKEISKHEGLDHDDTAGVLFSRFVDEQLKKQGLSIQDVGSHRTVIKQPFTSWEEFPRPEFENYSVFESLPPQLYATLDIEIASRENPGKRSKKQVSLPFLNGRFCALDFKGDDHHQLMSFYLMDGWNNEKITSSTAQKQTNIDHLLDQNDLTLDIQLSYQQKGVKWTRNFSVAKGTKAALCFSFGNTSPKTTSLFARPCLNKNEAEENLHSLLAFTGALYFEKCNRAQNLLASLHKIADPYYFGVGLAKLTSGNSIKTADTEMEIKFPQVDMAFYIHCNIDSFLTVDESYHLRLADYLILTCADYSSNEHQVIQDVFEDSDAISTIKLLKIAHKNHQERGLEGLGFLALTKRTHIAAEKNPYLSKFLDFPHLPDLNFEKIFTLGKEQWNVAGRYLKADDHTVAYMTPMPISNAINPITNSSSYTGFGTLIFNQNDTLAMISDALRVVNGGFGSGLLLKDLNAFDRVTQNLYSTKINSIALENWLNKPITSGFENKQPKLEEKRTPTVWLTKWAADVRQFFKPAYNTVSDPVDVVTGAFYIDEVDLTLPGPFPLELRRNYSNQNSVLTSLGHRWKLSLNPSLHEEGERLYAAEEDGSVIVYRKNDSNTKWIVLPEDNPDLYNSNKKGIGSSANPFHAFIVQDRENYLLFGSDGSKRIFKDHLLDKWINPAGHTLTFSYEDGQLKQIQSSNGSYIGFCYNFEGKISEAYAKDGRRIYYLYNSLGDLCKVILPNGAEVDYAYDSDHQILRETRPHGWFLENSYDEKGRVIQQRSPIGPQQDIVTSATFIYQDGVTVAIDASGATTEYKIFDKQIYKITDPLGYITLQSWFMDGSSYFDPERECRLPFDQSGGCSRCLKSTQDKRGLTTEYRYDEKGNPIDISLMGEDLTGLADQKITKHLSYNELNLLVEERAVNKVTRTTYDDQLPFLPKRIENFIDCTPLSFMEFTYENGLLKQENRSEAITCWSYDNRGFPIEISQETGGNNLKVVTTFRYNEQGQCVEKRAQDGMERNTYDIMGNRLQHSILDLEGNVLSTTYASYNLNNQLAWQQGSDSRNTLFLDYNANGQLKASRQSLTALAGNEVLHAGTAYRIYDYDTRGHLIEEVNPIGHSTFREYDALGRVSKETLDGLTTTFSYEAGGMVATITAPNGGKTTRVYTTNGLLKKEIYPDGTESSFAYDFFGRPILQSKNGMTLEITYDDALSTVTRIQKESGITETSKFDSRGNLISSTDAEGYTWIKSYDLLNRILTETDPEGHTTTWSYGKDTVSCTLPSGEIVIQRFVAGQLVESKTLGKRGDLLLHKLIHYYPEQSKMEEISGNIVTTTQSNTLGQPLIVQQGELITTYQYDHAGHCIASTDGEGRTTQREFDKLGRTAQHILPDGTPIRFTYDEGSNLVAYHLPDNLTWQATYDLMGRKTGEALHANNQSTQRWEYTYENGLLRQTKDPLGLTHEYTYDSALRLIAEHVGEMSRVFTYDQRGFVTSAEQTGRDHSVIKRSYDPSGNLIFETISLNGELLQQTDQTWTPSSRSLQIGDHLRDFHYEAGRLKNLSSSGLEFSYDYNLNGALTKKSTPFYSIDISYNLSGLPKTRNIHLLHDHYQEILNWTPSGKLARYTSNLQSSSDKTFSYNSRGYLKSADQDQFEFDFNKLGRGIRTSSPDHTIPPSGLDPFGKILTEMLKGKTSNITYDQAGQTTSKDGTEQFEWDPWGNLIAIQTPNYTWKASYDAFGRRLQTTYTKKGILWNTSLKTTSLFDPEHEFQEIGIKYNNKTFWKLYGPTSCDALIDNDGNTLALLQDALSNLKAIVSQDHTHWIEELPSPYGPTGPPLTLEPDLLTYAKSLSWQDNKLDPTGLIHLGARYYDPKTGRFLSPDPISYPTCLDLYTYANNDPVNFRDPSGRFASAVNESIKSTVFDTWNSPQFHGVLQVGSGVSQALGGAAYTAGTGGVGGLLGGGFLFFRGLDDIYTGGRQILSNQWMDSAKSQMLQACGVARDFAEGVDTLVNFVSPKNLHRMGSQVVETTKKAGRNRFTPDINAEGPHTVFRRDPTTRRVTNYETYKLQTNPRNPNQWESVKRLDGNLNHPHEHYNKVTKQDIPTPHIHDPLTPGGIRVPEIWEMP